MLNATEAPEVAEPAHIPFPEIRQYRQVIRSVAERARFAGKDAAGEPIYDNTRPLPKLVFSGTVKLHGTNAAICGDRATGKVWFQSREQIIEPGADNCGFAANFKDADLSHLLTSVDANRTGNRVAIFGEWCGQGVQGGTAISGLPKMFVVFAVKVDDLWLAKEDLRSVCDPTKRIFNVHHFETWGIEIDFERPELSQNGLAELTAQVEASCPAGRFFGVEGIGEGIVWRCDTPGWEDPRFWFKVKGEKHSATKVKTLAAVDVERAQTEHEFVERVVTEARLLQAVAKLREGGKVCDRTSMGDFLRLVFNDIAKEESDTAAASGIELKKIGGKISLAAKRWFLANESTFPL